MTASGLIGDTDRPVYLVLDGHTAHRAKATTDFVSSTNGRLRLFFLPGYSPELNPDEWVWKNIKHDRVGRAGITTITTSAAKPATPYTDSNNSPT